MAQSVGLMPLGRVTMAVTFPLPALTSLHVKVNPEWLLIAIKPSSSPPVPVPDASSSSNTSPKLTASFGFFADVGTVGTVVDCDSVLPGTDLRRLSMEAKRSLESGFLYYSQLSTHLELLRHRQIPQPLLSTSFGSCPCSCLLLHSVSHTTDL